MTALKNNGGSMKNDSQETRIALLEQSIGHISQTLLRLEKKMDEGFIRLDKKIDDSLLKLEKKIDEVFIRLDKKIDNNFSELNTRIDKLDLRIDKIDNRLWQIMFLISSSIIGLIIGKIFHLF